MIIFLTGLAVVLYIANITGSIFWLISKAVNTTQYGILTKDLIRIAKFQDRFNAPNNAEELTLSSTVERIELDGKYGGRIRNTDHVIYTCPKCKRKHELLFRHGDTVRCKCGLYSQTHGNNLKIWT